MDDEELPERPRPLPARWVRFAGLLLVVAALAVLITIRISSRRAHPVTAREAPVRAASHPPASLLPAWPTAPGACSSDVDLPIVSSTPPGAQTGIRVLLGGDRLRSVDFDSGRSTVIAAGAMRPGEFVGELAIGVQTYAITTSCGPAPTRILRLDDGRVSAVALASPVDTVLIDGFRVWRVSLSATGGQVWMALLPGGRRIRLPDGFLPQAVTDGVLVGYSATDSLTLVDVATGRRLGDLGRGLLLAAGHGVVLWAVGCDPGIPEPCTLRSRAVAGGRVNSYRLPRPPGLAGPSVLSADGRLLTVPIERAGPDPRYQSGHPLPPSEIAIVRLGSGKVQIVPGIELPAKTSPGLAFSADDRWLLISIDAGTRIRLLAWRSGLIHPYETAPIAATVVQSAPVAVINSAR